jgi:hypothetical protein
MGQFDTGVDHWRERLRAHEEELQTYLAGGRAYVFERGERVDITERLVKELRSAIAMYHRVIGTYERLYLHQGPQVPEAPRRRDRSGRPRREDRSGGRNRERG